MRNLLHRLRDAFLDFITGDGIGRDACDERMRADAQLRFHLQGMRELSPVDAALVEEYGATFQALRRDPVYDYLEPIGPQPMTVEDRYRLFEADPLEAELPGTPAKDNPAFAELHASLDLSKPVAEDLELTRGWEIGQLRWLAQMAGKAER